MQPDYPGDGLNLDGHITGDPFKSKSSGQATPSGGMAGILLLGLLGLLVLMAFGFRSIRI